MHVPDSLTEGAATKASRRSAQTDLGAGWPASEQIARLIRSLARTMATPHTLPLPQDAVRLERNSRGWVIGDQAWSVVGDRSHGRHGHSVLVATARAGDRPLPYHDVTFRLFTIPRLSV